MPADEKIIDDSQDGGEIVRVEVRNDNLRRR